MVGWKEWRYLRHLAPAEQEQIIHRSLIHRAAGLRWQLPKCPRQNGGGFPPLAVIRYFRARATRGAISALQA